jgi:hypothetical protein
MDLSGYGYLGNDTSLLSADSFLSTLPRGAGGEVLNNFLTMF